MWHQRCFMYNALGTQPSIVVHKRINHGVLLILGSLLHVMGYIFMSTNRINRVLHTCQFFTLK